MSCDSVQELISALLDGRLRQSERETVSKHLGSCQKCVASLAEMERLRGAMRGMNRLAMPAALPDRLRVMASHARARQLERATLASRWEALSGSARLWFDNLMRPVALPAAGGLLSAMVLFSLLVPTLSFSQHFADEIFLTSPDGQVGAESSDGFYEPASYGEILKLLPSKAKSSDFANVVWLTVDENGKVVDYAIERGNLTPDLQSIILFSQFIPATVLGLPTAGKIRVAQQSPERRLPSRGSIRS